ncbi:Hypothetical protein DEACI_0078 [Acididesulfobacillus acetoxydans]|uniref:Uncharacterized protein n=1 Tax=Acididesulfobacillus acetoxydans TaxID=1561005 RepID=A0A8S0XA25_9FIRM|nr:Hypothetical protein DEACI_0078 [Acididesulfobacillus acetoxydans]CEJ06739.1 Hypothetical protein DEACI_1190 [Acididesulfobacillus acetoxydans]
MICRVNFGKIGQVYLERESLEVEGKQREKETLEKGEHMFPLFQISFFSGAAFPGIFAGPAEPFLRSGPEREREQVVCARGNSARLGEYPGQYQSSIVSLGIDHV